MSRRPLVLAIDNGTQSVRAIVVDAAGLIVASGREVLCPYVSRRPGWAEQDPDYYWAGLGKACAKLWATGKVRADEIAAVTITTQRGSLFFLDEAGNALRPGILWLDQRKASAEGGIGGLWDTLFKVAGVSATVRDFRRKSPCNWVAEHEPDIWQRTRRVLLLSGYLSWRMTDRYVDSTGAQVGYLPFDYRRQTWAVESDWKWRAIPVRREQLPELVAPGQSLGVLSGAAAQHLGLPVGLPVIAAASDKACEILGSGGRTPEIGCISYGTTATINTNNTRYVEATRWIPPYPSAIPGQYNTEIMVFRGFWMVSWFKQEFGLKEQQEADALGIETEQLFDELLRQVPPGSMGLMLQPYWSPGVREPGPEAKGSIIGFGDVHTRAHLYRAILEGLAYALREGRERIERRNGCRMRLLRVSGGGARSDMALQLTADIFNLPVERPHTSETSALGAAMDAMVGLGIHADMETAISAMTRCGTRFEPDADAVRVYDALYRGVYQKMYRRLQPLYRTIQEITGYPAAD